jgi:2-amino-4-hydroxy-6-hydroxymethyldihydropteridine diphosphokinase
MPVTAYVALGSNLGDREGFIRQALKILDCCDDVTMGRVSSLIETEPIGGPAGQHAYLNGVVELSTNLAATDLLRTLLDIEKRLGRVRKQLHGPRTIDLDLLLYGNQILSERECVVPHPRMHQRLFVIQPLAEIAPNVFHPILGKSASSLLADLGSRSIQSADMPPSPMREYTSTLLGLRGLVTGATRGIGAVMATCLGAAGADVIIHGRDVARGNEVAEALRKQGRQAAFIAADLRKANERHQLASEAWHYWGSLDFFINNAGADILTGDQAALSFEQKLRELLTVDVEATIYLSREIGRQMKVKGKGKIVTMGWDQACVGMEGDSGQLFAAAKGAVEAFTKSLAITLAPEVRVNCLAPGWIQTAWGETASERWQARVMRETPLGRWGKPADVAATACWLLSPAADFITGQVIRINGGAVR